MKKIKEIVKFDNSPKTVDQWDKYCDERVGSIRSNYIERKKKLLEYSNESIVHLAKILKENNLYFEREKTFFTEMGDLFYSDFYIHELRLTIEVDGGYHELEKRKYNDKAKELFLLNRSIATIRFTNENVLKLEQLTYKYLEILAKRHWNQNKDEKEIEDYNYKYRYWQSRVIYPKTEFIQELKESFKESLINHHTNKKVQLYNKENEVLWEFKNIFDYHFKTGLRFKEVLNKFNTKSKNWKTRLRYVD